MIMTRIWTDPCGKIQRLASWQCYPKIFMRLMKNPITILILSKIISTSGKSRAITGRQGEVKQFFASHFQGSSLKHKIAKPKQCASCFETMQMLKPNLSFHNFAMHHSTERDLELLLLLSNTGRTHSQEPPKTYLDHSRQDCTRDESIQFDATEYMDRMPGCLVSTAGPPGRLHCCIRLVCKHERATGYWPAMASTAKLRPA